LKSVRQPAPCSKNYTQHTSCRGPTIGPRRLGQLLLWSVSRTATSSTFVTLATRASKFTDEARMAHTTLNTVRKSKLTASIFHTSLQIYPQRKTVKCSDKEAKSRNASACAKFSGKAERACAKTNQMQPTTTRSTYKKEIWLFLRLMEFLIISTTTRS
jgi:hypothetical protein